MRSSNPSQSSDQGFSASVPDSDPTALTTAQLQREVAGLKELLFTRLDAMDKAVNLLQDLANRSPSIAEVATSVGHLQALHDEKFSSIQKQFDERDTRNEQAARDVKVAVDAALEAAKEIIEERNRSSAMAVAKSEAFTLKQIDQIGVLIATTVKANDDKFADTKERITIIESHSKGSRDGWGYAVGVIGLVLTLASLVTLVLKFAK